MQSGGAIALAPDPIPSVAGSRSPAPVRVTGEKLREGGTPVVSSPEVARVVGSPERSAAMHQMLQQDGSSAEHQALLKYEAILNNASVGICFTRVRVIQHANPALEEMFGWPLGSLNGQPGIVLWGSEEVYREIGLTVGPILSQGKSIELECKMKRRDETLFWVHIQARPIDPVNPSTGGTIWIMEDITERRHAVERLRHVNEELEQRVRARTEELADANAKLKLEISERQQMEERARHLSMHDALTGLPNRRLLQDRLAQLLAQARREGWSVAVMFIDLDRFKRINDSLGHATGDDVLREMAKRLTESLRDSDTVSRVGGDEFVLLLPHI